MFDGRNIINLSELEDIGFQVWAVGKACNAMQY